MDFESVYNEWRLSSAIKDAERRELDELSADAAEREDRFFRTLEFGTAGLRGIVGMGTNRMNIYTVRQAVWGFGESVTRHAAKTVPPLVCLCFDCRPSSRDFSREAARVLAGMGIRVLMFLEPRPTPQLSFAVRHFGADGGINITASHNPKEYNGFKAYWSDGAQLSLERADEVAALMAAYPPLECRPGISFSLGSQNGMIKFMGKEVDKLYIDAVLKNKVAGSYAESARDMKLVYTPFHGVGGAVMPQVFAQAGFKNVGYVEQQMEPDGTFPTISNPNPEDPEGFALAVEQAKQVGAYAVIGTDPDADRVAVVARDEAGEYVPLTGNQIGGLLCDYILGANAAQGTMPELPTIIQTVVTGRLSRRVAQDYGAEVLETFTGFRFMAEKVAELERAGRGYLLAYEEAIGYMAGNHVRDKDGITASMLIAEMAAYHYTRGNMLTQALDALWRRHGYFQEKTISVMFPGQQGMLRMDNIMKNLRDMPPKVISGERVVVIKDFLRGEQIVVKMNMRSKLDKRGMDVLYYELSDDTVLIVRPSGTEPKIKLYIHTVGKSLDEARLLAARYAGEAEDTLRI